MKKNYFSKITAVFLMFAVVMLSLVTVDSVYASDTPDVPVEVVESIVEGVVANTSVKPSGQCLENLVVTVSDAEALTDLSAEDFSLAGQAAGWLTSNLHDFTATISDVAVDGNVMTLTVTDFTEKYLYVDNYTVTCSANAALTFTSDKITSVVTPIADEFEQIKEEANGGMDYNLYTPADTSKPQPIVIAFHGYGDNENLYQNKLAVAWATPENQAERPCYVLAPSVTSYFSGSYRTALYEKVMALVDEMVEAGKVDPDRIYVVGKSFGGAAVYEFSSKYVEDVAGAIAMCGAASYLGVKTPTIETLVDTPLWIAHATTDGTVGVTDSRTVYETLVNAGSEVVKFKEYSDEEMIAAGVTAAMGNHSVEVPVLEDVQYMEWLFKQNNLVKGVIVNTTVKPSGQCLETIEITVKDADVLKDLKAEDFSLAGKASGWLNPSLHDFTATISDVAVDGNVLTLTVTDFMEKYLYVDSFTVTCSANSRLTITSDQITSVITPVADEFEQIKEEANGGMDYNLYTPADTSKPQPIVIAFHGYGDNENLYQNKLAVAWATPENQAERPCYVLAPSVTSYFSGSYRTALYEKVMALVNEMVEAGKVDPERIYVVGKSFGGAAVYEFSSKYVEDVAGAIAMCGAVSYLGIKTPTIEKLVDTPLWIAHATTDGTVGVTDSRNVYNTLKEAGSKVVKFKEYTDEEMIAAGVTAAMGNHSVEVPVLEDEAYMEWLFAQPQKIELPFEDVKEGDWYYDSVAYVYENEIMNGKETTIFAPDENLTRAQFVTILYRMDGSEDVTYEDIFSDVKDNNWYTDAIIWANSKGIVKGYANSKLFGVNDEITREQMVTMLYRYADYKGYDVEASDSLESYTDAKAVSVFALDAMKWAIAEGVINGVSETEIAPQETATRAQCAAIAERFMKAYN